MKTSKLIILFILIMCSFVSNGKDNFQMPNKILILGNSIVAHAPKPDIGWVGDWGMAASCKDSDFVHILIRNINEENNQAIVKFKNIAEFERNFKSYDLGNFQSLREFEPDIIVIKISENVNDSIASKDDFQFYYERLINYLDPNNDANKIIVNGFWPRPVVNKIVEHVASSNNYDFVSITSLFDDSTNTAKGLFDNEGVALHPSDKGMRCIANLIWEKLQKCF